MVYDTPSSEDAFTHQIWNTYLKESVRYAPDSMQFLETRSEVKFKDTVTQLWYALRRHSKMHHHTNFGIPNSKNIGDMHLTRSGMDGLTDRWTVRLLYASQSSFGGTKIVDFLIPTQESRVCLRANYLLACYCMLHFLYLVYYMTIF